MVTKDLLRGGGIEKYTREVGRRLVQRGHEVTAFSTGGTGPRPNSWNGMDIVWLPKGRPYWSEKLAGAAMATVREFRMDRPDVVHLHSVAAGSMAAALRWRGSPCLVQMHGVEWQRSRWSSFARLTLRALEAATFRCGHAFTAVSNVQCRYYEQRYSVPVEFIPTAAGLAEPADPSLLAPLGVAPGRYVFSASRLVPEKGIHYLIQAFRHVRTDWKLVVGGAAGGAGGYARALREMAAGDSRILFTGHVEGELLQALFGNAGAYAQPSEMEGLAMSLIEAMGHGVLCIASDIPENREALGTAGVLFRSRDPRDLADKLDWAVKNPSRGSMLGVKARRRVADLYTWDRVTAALEDLYQRTILQFGQRGSAGNRPSGAPAAGAAQPGHAGVLNAAQVRSNPQ
jgi:glycosyltransferase involved in cell wall biosynthesis